MNLEYILSSLLKQDFVDIDSIDQYFSSDTKYRYRYRGGPVSDKNMGIFRALMLILISVLLTTRWWYLYWYPWDLPGDNKTGISIVEKIRYSPLLLHSSCIKSSIFTFLSFKVEGLHPSSPFLSPYMYKYLPPSKIAVIIWTNVI